MTIVAVLASWFLVGAVLAVSTWCQEQYTQTHDMKGWRAVLHVAAWPVALWASVHLARRHAKSVRQLGALIQKVNSRP